jgi:hypothetical protein
MKQREQEQNQTHRPGKGQPISGTQRPHSTSNTGQPTEAFIAWSDEGRSTKIEANLVQVEFEADHALRLAFRLGLLHAECENTAIKSQQRPRIKITHEGTIHAATLRTRRAPRKCDWEWDATSLAQTKSASRHHVRAGGRSRAIRINACSESKEEERTAFLAATASSDSTALKRQTQAFEIAKQCLENRGTKASKAETLVSKCDCMANSHTL